MRLSKLVRLAVLFVFAGSDTRAPHSQAWAQTYDPTYCDNCANTMQCANGSPSCVPVPTSLPAKGGRDRCASLHFPEEGKCGTVKCYLVLRCACGQQLADSTCVGGCCF
jgi:hypothetical protein